MWKRCVGATELWLGEAARAGRGEGLARRGHRGGKGVSGEGGGRVCGGCMEGVCGETETLEEAKACCVPP